MASKKKSSALAALGADVSTSNLAKAGVEVKLTKGEIAEYIANKAMARISEEIAAIEASETCGRSGLYYAEFSVANAPKRVRNVLAALNALGTLNSYRIKYSNRLATYGTPRGHWVIVDNTSHIVSVPLDESEDVPPEFAAWEEKKNRYDALVKKLQDLRSKNYKVLLVESILSGSVAGTTVLADLNRMVADMVATPTVSG